MRNMRASRASISIIAFVLALFVQSSMTIAQCLFAPHSTILFQGDSITDMGRGRTLDPNHILGHGYAFIIAAREGADYPDDRLTFLNRGVSGNETGDLEARWQTDTLDLKPDVLSILIGVNNVGHKLKAEQPFSVDEYQRSYDRLLSETVKALPNIKLILCEPFFGEGKGTKAHLDQWKAIMPQVDSVVEKLAAKYHAPVVHFQKMFDEALKRAPIDYWIWDGVHPTYSGHQLMADEWKRVYREFYGPPSTQPAATTEQTAK
jgi:lysophospholipase L1-like esterase